MSVARAHLAGIFMLLAAGCSGGGDMSEFRAKWQALSSSRNAPEETAMAEALADYARAHAITYQIALTDPDNGAPVALGQLDTLARVPKVLVTLREQGRNLELSWQPLSKESIYPFLLE